MAKLSCKKENKLCHEPIVLYAYIRCLLMIWFNFCKSTFFNTWQQPVWSNWKKAKRKIQTFWTFSLLLIFNDYARESDRPTQFFFILRSVIYITKGAYVYQMSANEPCLPLISPLAFNGSYLVFSPSVEKKILLQTL